MCKKVIVSFLSILLILTTLVYVTPNGSNAGVMVASAATEAELRAKQASLEKEQATLKSKISALKSSQADAQAQVDEINKLIENLSTQIDTLNSQIAVQNEEIAGIEAEISAKQRNIDESYEKFKQRVRSMYISGDLSGGLELLLCSDDFQDFLSRMTYVEAMAQHDQEIIDALTEDRNGFQAQKAQIEQKKAEIESQKSVLSQKKAELDEQKAEADALLAQIAADKAALQVEQAKIDKEMASARAQLDAIIRNATANDAGSSYVGGAWRWPAPGYTRITSKFGYRAWSNSYHKGIDIGAPTGAAIVASNAGTVVTSSYDANGYGNYVIINHGGGYMTVYGHLSRKSVSVGQNVSRGQTIGLCGSTGRSTGPHLHFEIRVNGTAKNPLNYLG